MRKIKIELVESDYSEITDESISVIKTDKGLYTGTAHLSQEDKESGYGSSFLGCEIAEIRAQIRYFKDVIQDIRRKIVTYSVELEGTSSFNYLKRKDLKKKLRALREDEIECKKLLRNLYKTANTRVDAHISLLNKINNKKEKTE